MFCVCARVRVYVYGIACLNTYFFSFANNSHCWLAGWLFLGWLWMFLFFLLEKHRHSSTNFLCSLFNLTITFPLLAYYINANGMRSRAARKMYWVSQNRVTTPHFLWYCVVCHYNTTKKTWKTKKKSRNFEKKNNKLLWEHWMIKLAHILAPI